MLFQKIKGLWILKRMDLIIILTLCVSYVVSVYEAVASDAVHKSKPKFAQQFVLHDNICSYPVSDSAYIHGAGAAFHKWRPGPNVILNWEKPVNYRDGKAYVRYEVMEMQETGKWCAGFSMWSAGRRLHYSHWLYPFAKPLEKGKVVTFEVEIQKLRWDGSPGYKPEDWDWTNVTSEGYIFCACQDDPPRYRHPWDEKADKNLPTYDAMKPVKNRVTVIIVAKGAEFVPPKGWYKPGGLGKVAKNLKIPLQYYQIAQLYGPGMPPSGKEGLHTKLFEMPVDRVGLVIVHPWNLGEPDGPYPIEPGVHKPGEASDWVPKAHEIIATKIKPVLEATRKAGIAVFHLAQYVYAPRYPQYLKIAADPEFQSPEKKVEFDVCVNPRTVKEMWETEYGPDFPGPVWKTHADKFNIARSLRPLPNEDVFLNGWQLNGLCRRKKIDTLFYVGFMADLCLVNIPGAIREMAYKFKYRCVVLRECTTAYEFAETYKDNWMTFAAIRLIESGMGYSASADDFMAACETSLSSK